MKGTTGYWDDKAEMDKLIADAAAIASQDTPKPAPKFCGN